MSNRLGNVSWLQRIEIHRLAFVHRTKAAMPSARIAAEHERRGLVSPAFKDVRALGFLADGMEIKAVDEFENRVLILRIAELDLEPIRLLEPLTALSIEKILN